MQLWGGVPYYPHLTDMVKGGQHKSQIQNIHTHAHKWNLLCSTVSYQYGSFLFKYWPYPNSVSRNSRCLSWRCAGKSYPKGWKHWLCSRILQKPVRKSCRRKSVLRMGYNMEVSGYWIRKWETASRGKTERWERNIQWGKNGIFP